MSDIEKAGEPTGVEQIIQSIEKTTAALEAEDCTIDEALGLYAHGVERIRAARSAIEKARLRIRLIDGEELDPDELGAATG